MLIKNNLRLGCLVFIGAWSLAGCSSIKTTTTARTATEQLLLSTAADHALHDLGLEMFAGRKVFVDVTYFDSYDAKYVEGTVRDALSRAGARLEDAAGNSDFVLEARSGALAIDEEDFMFGIPAITLPIPLAGAVQTPEVAFYKAQKQRSMAKFALLAYNHQSSSHVYSSGPLDGNSFDSHFRVLFISWHRTDVPEKQLTHEMSQKRQTWLPQYDQANLATTNAPAQTTNAPAQGK
jgi:hypothetical protein